MNDLSTQAKVTVANVQGLHMRPADLLVKMAGRFASEISIEKDGQRVDAKSIMGLLTLNAVHGSVLTIIADGADASQAIAELVDFFARGFDEPEEDEHA